MQSMFVDMDLRFIHFALTALFDQRFSWNKTCSVLFQMCAACRPRRPIPRMP